VDKVQERIAEQISYFTVRGLPVPNEMKQLASEHFSEVVGEVRRLTAELETLRNLPRPDTLTEAADLHAALATKTRLAEAEARAAEAQLALSRFYSAAAAIVEASDGMQRAAMLLNATFGMNAENEHALALGNSVPYGDAAFAFERERYFPQPKETAELAAAYRKKYEEEILTVRCPQCDETWPAGQCCGAVDCPLVEEPKDV